MLVGTHTFRSRFRRLSAHVKVSTVLLTVAAALCLFAGESQVSAQTLTSLYNFGLSPDGDEPSGPLTLAADGSFVGTTQQGGANGTGCVYDITTSGKETVLYNFTALNGTSLINLDGAKPTSGVILGADGNYYGCTTTGGTSGNGTIFQLTPAGVLTTLIDFQGSDGSSPAGLVESSTAGTFYGTTKTGGTNNTGTIFELLVTTTTVTTGTTTTTTSFGDGVTLYEFSALDSDGTNSDGAYPTAPPIIGADGKLYGTASGGGNSIGTGLTNGEAIGGSVWTITAAGTGFAVLHLFTSVTSGETNADGTHPQAGLAQIADGTLVGSCKDGGTNGTGTLFDVTTTGTYNVLHTFGAITSVSGLTPLLNADGISPAANVVQLASGAIYGTCSAGGTSGAGTLFDYIPATTEVPAASFDTFYSFGPQATSVQDGKDPLGVLAEDALGNLYGTTAAGGAYASYAGSGVGGIFFQIPLAAASTATPPTVTGLSPSSAPAGGNAFTLTITGAGFDGDAVVTWRVTSTLTVALATTYFSATQLTAVVPANLIGIDAVLNAGTAEAHAISVVNADTGAASAASASFTVTPSTGTAPTIKALSPTAIVVGSAATTLTITGIHFFTGDTVTVNGTTLTPSQVTATQVTVTLPASLLTLAQSLSVTVSSSAGASNALAFTVTPLTTFAAGLQLISLPYDYPGVALSTVFGYASPKLAVWNAVTSTYAVTPTAPADAIRLGRAYWVRFPGTTGVDISGTPATAGTAFTIDLAKGWNMIGDPFVTAVSGTAITITTSTSTTSYTFNDAAANAIIGSNTYSYEPNTNSYVGDNTGDMQPFFGYWIYANQACSLLINGS